MHQIRRNASSGSGANTLFRLLVCLFLICTTGPSAAQPTPSPAAVASTITFILPGAVDGSADRVGRIIARALARALQTQVQVKTIPGGLGITGTNAIARAPRDGSTLGLGLSTPMAGGKLLSRTADYNPIDSFDWLAIIGTYGNAMIVRQDHPAKSLLEWLALARVSPKPLRYGTGGAASAAHIAGEFLRVEQHLNMVHVPFGTNAQAYAALASGEIDVLFDGIPSARVAVDPARFRILAVTSQKRDPHLPDAPAFGEIWRNQSFELWAAIVAPNPLPPDQRSRIVAAIGVLLTDKSLVTELQDAGINWLGLAGNDAGQFVRDDIVRKARQIGDLAIQPASMP
jgi:tripartite-type tricarboxylate transporter receptor subunit TctC